MNILTGKGYLKSEIKCHYFRNAFMYLMIEKVEVPYKISSESKEISIECPLHGTLITDEPKR